MGSHRSSCKYCPCLLFLLHSKDDAVSRAFDEIEADWEISKAWKQNAEVSFVEEQKKPKDDSGLDKLN